MIWPSMLALLAIVATVPLALGQPPVRTLRLMTKDDVGISAAFYPVVAETAPAVLLLHAVGQNRDEWAGVAMMLQRNGIACLTIDLRGHGESNRRLTAQGAAALDYRSFQERDYANMVLDITAAMRWLTQQPTIDKNRVAIIGSAFGANLALHYATFNPTVTALLLFSPGLNYQGFHADDDIKKIGPMPLRIYVARSDEVSFPAAKRLLAIRQELGYTADPQTLVVCSGDLVGSHLLVGVEKLPNRMLEWLQQILQGIQPPAPAPPPPPARASPSTPAPATK